MNPRRTHPITGFKSLYVDKSSVSPLESQFTVLIVLSRFTTRIVELGTEESATILEYLTRHISENHDLQVRYRWSANDVAIWDNRCALHTATYVELNPMLRLLMVCRNDYGSKARKGNRIVGIGEKPFFDPSSVSRRASFASAASQ